ncbi:hypothetical protein V5799_002927 [Amblyomma americanum]|uniref:Uncharacterized protein n=1 Tax=Amblyomma americanum TaxID=6943 RepID=A0AAQ4DAF1_AMBAM
MHLVSVGKHALVIDEANAERAKKGTGRNADGFDDEYFPNNDSRVDGDAFGTDECDGDDECDYGLGGDDDDNMDDDEDTDCECWCLLELKSEKQRQNFCTKFLHSARHWHQSSREYTSDEKSPW